MTDDSKGGDALQPVKKPTFGSLFAGIQSAASTSDSSGPDGTAASRSNGTPIVPESSPSTGPMWPDLETSTMSTERPLVRIGTHTASRSRRSEEFARNAAPTPREIAFYAPDVSLALISSPAASLASRSATRDSDGEWRTIVGYGPSSPDAFASYDPVTSSWRTSQGSWLDTEGWGTSLATWPPSGMTRSGRAFPRRPLVPRTSDTASGSWHTPTATDSDGKPKWDHRASPGYVRAKPVPNLMAQVQERFLTPSANEDAAGRPGSKMQKMLGNDPKVRGEGDGGTLNPTWVEWLMGFPLGWTDLGHSATPSSRKSSSSSAAASSKRRR